MLPLSLKAINFTSYINEIIEFDSFGDIFAVIGENGAGKSSIIDMITAALFFRARGVDNRGSGMDELINSNAQFFELTYEFVMNSIHYKVVRRKSRSASGGHELEFYIDGESQSEGVKETQQKILDVLKVDYDTFMDTVCIGQGKSGSFMEKAPDKRKDVFSQVFGLNKYEFLEKYTRELKKSVTGDIDKVEEKLLQLREKITDKNKYESEVDTFTTGIKKSDKVIKEKEVELEQVLAEKVKYEQIKKQRDHILNQRTNLFRKITNIENSLTDDNNTEATLTGKITQKESVVNAGKRLQEKIDTEQTEYTNLSNQKSSLEATNNMLISQAKELKTKFDNLKNYNKADCDFCGHQITANYKQEHMQKLMDEGKKYMKDVNDNKQLIADLENKLRALNDSLSKNRSNLRLAQTEITKIAQAETQLSGVQRRIKDNSSALEELKQEYEENLKIEIGELEERTFNDVTLKREIEWLRNDYSKMQSQIAVTKNKLEEIKAAGPQIDKLNDELRDLQNTQDDYTDLINAWGKSGIQAVIIENALPEIENEINDLLQLLTGGKVEIEFRTQKEAKTKKKAKNPASIDTLDIIVNSDGVSRKYETYSGGEKFRVDFACHVGLAKFLAKRAGASIDFFIVDEGLGSQDENARAAFLNSISQLPKVFRQVMIITHIDDMKEAFTNKVLVERDPVEGSKVTLLAE